MKLTTQQIIDSKYKPDGPSQQLLWDDQLKKFGVRLNPGGSKSFFIRYRTDGRRQRYLTIGRFGELTLQEARMKAMRRLLAIEDGKDPQLERKRARHDTMSSLVTLFIEKHCKPRRKTWKADRARLRRHVVPRWADHRPRDLTPQELSQLHRQIGENAKIEANRVIETIRTMYNFAQREGIVPDGYNPAEKVNRYKEQSRDRWLRPHEFEPLATAINQVHNPFLHHYYWLLALTATRRNEMLEAKWSHVDLENRELFLPNTKNGRDHRVPLSSVAVSLFRDIPRKEGNPWVFCSHIRGQRIQEVNKRWRRIRSDAGLDDVQLHDLRRTAASWIAQEGYSGLAIKKLLNHTLEGPTAIYARLNLTIVREAIEWYSEAILEAVGGVSKLFGSTPIS